MNLTSITYTGADNMGGNRRALFADTDLITALGYQAADGTIAASTTFTGSGAWHSLYFTEDSAGFQEEMVQGVGGPQWRNTFTANVPGDDATLRPLVEEMARRRLIWDVQDANGLWRRMGTKRNMPRMQYRRTTADGSAGFNGYTLTITWLSQDPCGMPAEH